VTHLHKGLQVTFAQTWDVGYGTDDQAPAAPRRLATSAGPRLAPQCTGSLTTPQYPPDLVVGATALCQILLAIGPEAAKAARDFTSRTLRDWRLDELIEEAVLIASELVTNAIRYGQRTCPGGAVEADDAAKVELAWHRQASRVICMVTDRSPLPPVLGSVDQDSESGRGLLVVQALADTWGWMMLGTTSKAVWAALTIQP
jgi:anti-sigma regulatory factor (Ser/Thr protein kinase)